MSAGEIAKRVLERYKGWIPLAEWGPVCAGCGADEFRIDGYCCIECRDEHSDEEAAALARAYREAEKTLREIASDARIGWMDELATHAACVTIEERARAFLAEQEKGVTHGRHCPCSACARQDWSESHLAPCGMHGPECPGVYEPVPLPPERSESK